MLADDTLT